MYIEWVAVFIKNNNLTFEEIRLIAAESTIRGLMPLSCLYMKPESAWRRFRGQCIPSEDRPSWRQNREVVLIWHSDIHTHFAVWFSSCAQIRKRPGRVRTSLSGTLFFISYKNVTTFCNFSCEQQSLHLRLEPLEKLQTTLNPVRQLTHLNN